MPVKYVNFTVKIIYFKREKNKSGNKGLLPYRVAGGANPSWEGNQANISLR